MSWHDLKKEDFPQGEPVLKMKRGTWYRPENNGYCTSLLDAGLYDREEALQYCFDGDRNGKYGVMAVPIREAMNYEYYCRDRIRRYKERLDLLSQYATEDKIQTVVF